MAIRGKYASAEGLIKVRGVYRKYTQLSSLDKRVHSCYTPAHYYLNQKWYETENTSRRAPSGIHR